MEKIQPDLISLDPTELAQVDQATWEQRHQDRVEVLVSVLKQLCIYNYLRCISVYFDIGYSRLNIIATHLKACFIFFFFCLRDLIHLLKKSLSPSIRKKVVVLQEPLRGARNKWLMRSRGWVVQVRKWNLITSHWLLCCICRPWLISLDLFTPQDVIRKSVEDKMKMEKERKERERKKAALSTQKSALDRFKK